MMQFQIFRKGRQIEVFDKCLCFENFIRYIARTAECTVELKFSTVCDIYVTRVLEKTFSSKLLTNYFLF